MLMVVLQVGVVLLHCVFLKRHTVDRRLLSDRVFRVNLLLLVLLVEVLVVLLLAVALLVLIAVALAVLVVHLLRLHLLLLKVELLNHHALVLGDLVVVELLVRAHRQLLVVQLVEVALGLFAGRFLLILLKRLVRVLLSSRKTVDLAQLLLNLLTLSG
jgi:hypothetical protein